MVGSVHGFPSVYFYTSFPWVSSFQLSLQQKINFQEEIFFIKRHRHEIFRAILFSQASSSSFYLLQIPLLGRNSALHFKTNVLASELFKVRRIRNNPYDPDNDSLGLKKHYLEVLCLIINHKGISTEKLDSCHSPIAYSAEFGVIYERIRVARSVILFNGKLGDN
jgi:hypothetical protein